VCEFGRREVLRGPRLAFAVGVVPVDELVIAARGPARGDRSERPAVPATVDGAVGAALLAGSWSGCGKCSVIAPQ
jgi:hypothetical protein